MSTPELVPFIKWVGGKRNVIKKYLFKFLPKEFNNYYEPFLGGGAMLFYLRPKNAFVNDINKELIISYNQIKENSLLVMKKLDKYKSLHSKDFFYKLRENYKLNPIDIAARFIYLNKTCFNGLYRVNSKNKFNVPFNGINKEKLNLYNYKNLKNISEYFNSNNIVFYNNDYLDFLKLPKKGDFIFVDSPYDYENIQGFDNYNNNRFGKENQIKLANKLKYLNSIGVKFMATNHDTKLINELYKDFSIIQIKTNRFINSNASKRKLSGDEVIILNY